MALGRSVRRWQIKDGSDGGSARAAGFYRRSDRTSIIADPGCARRRFADLVARSASEVDARRAAAKSSRQAGQRPRGGDRFAIACTCGGGRAWFQLEHKRCRRNRALAAGRARRGVNADPGVVRRRRGFGRWRAGLALAPNRAETPIGIGGAALNAARGACGSRRSGPACCDATPGARAGIARGRAEDLSLRRYRAGA